MLKRIMDKASYGRRFGQCPGFRRGARLCAHRPYILCGKRSRRQVEGSLAASCPPVLTGAPAGLKPFEIAKRCGLLLLVSSPGRLALAGRDDRLRDEVVEQVQETARILPSRLSTRQHQPLL